jgi:isocitrate dehydrogenase
MTEPKATPPETPDQDSAEQQSNLYDRMAERAQELFKAGRDKSREAMEAAVEKARQQMTESGLFSSERGQAFKEYLLKDLERMATFSRELGEEAKVKLDPGRLGAGALASLSTLLHLAGDAFRDLAAKTDKSLACGTGELTSAGSLTCSACGKIISLKKSGHIPPCPNCQGTQFKKGY